MAMYPKFGIEFATIFTRVYMVKFGKVYLYVILRGTSNLQLNVSPRLAANVGEGR